MWRGFGEKRQGEERRFHLPLFLVNMEEKVLGSHGQ